MGDFNDPFAGNFFGEGKPPGADDQPAGLPERPRRQIKEKFRLDREKLEKEANQRGETFYPSLRKQEPEASKQWSNRSFGGSPWARPGSWGSNAPMGGDPFADLFGESAGSQGFGDGFEPMGNTGRGQDLERSIMEAGDDGFGDFEDPFQHMSQEQYGDGRDPPPEPRELDEDAVKERLDDSDIFTDVDEDHVTDRDLPTRVYRGPDDKYEDLDKDFEGDKEGNLRPNKENPLSDAFFDEFETAGTIKDPPKDDRVLQTSEINLAPGTYDRNITGGSTSTDGSTYTFSDDPSPEDGAQLPATAAADAEGRPRRRIKAKFAKDLDDLEKRLNLKGDSIYRRAGDPISDDGRQSVFTGGGGLVGGGTRGGVYTPPAKTLQSPGQIRAQMAIEKIARVAMTAAKKRGKKKGGAQVIFI